MSASLLMLLAVAAPAQIRLHNEANDELAKKTREAFEAFSKGDANVFETMISNTLALKSATLEQLYELNRQTRRDTINLIPVKTWEELLALVKQTQQDFLDAYNASQLILDPLSAPAADVKTALAAAQKKAADAKTAKDLKQQSLDTQALNLKSLKDSLEKLRDEATASTKPVKKLSDLTQFQRLKGVWGGINEVKDWLEAAEKAGNAPGLQLIILDLGVQHQQFEVERLKLQLEEAAAAQNIADRIEQRLKVVWGSGNLDPGTQLLTEGLFGQIYSNIQPCGAPRASCSNPFVTDETKGQQVLETIGRLAVAAKAEVGTPLKATLQLRNLLDVLERYVVLVGYHKYLLLSDTIEAGVDTHLFSIRLSALNTKDREMLVSHGLDGLAAYHAGGLKPEEIANFFRAAQSIALGVLAGRVR